MEPDEATPPEGPVVDAVANAAARSWAVAVVGRPNVGKSTLFNRLTRTRNALVADVPGLTRDRQYGVADIDGLPVTLIDTGGVPDEVDPGVVALMADQVAMALEEADVVLFVVDIRAGVTAFDHELADRLRSGGLDVLLIANKVDGIDPNLRAAELFELGLGDPCFVAASHGRGVSYLQTKLAERLRALGAEAPPSEPPADAALAVPPGLKVAIVGRPNVGKSTLVNRLVGEERVVVFDQPGTTRDSIYVPLEVDDEQFVLIDTAGVRRRGRVVDTVEKFSVVQALAAMRAADVVLLVVDGAEGLVDQDLHLLGFALELGRTLLLVVNKWDGLSADARVRVRTELDRRLTFAPWLEQRFVSALHGSGVGHLLPDALALHENARVRFSSSELTRVLEDAVASHPPPSVRGRRIKLRFAHPGGDSPPVVVIHGNQTDSVPGPYRRYLENVYRRALGLGGAPIKIEFRTGINPYAGKKNVLTESQKRQRARMIRHVKRKDRSKRK